MIWVSSSLRINKERDVKQKNEVLMHRNVTKDNKEILVVEESVKVVKIPARGTANKHDFL
jgi:hypothetical protein